MASMPESFVCDRHQGVGLPECVTQSRKARGEVGDFSAPLRDICSSTH